LGPRVASHTRRQHQKRRVILSYFWRINQVPTVYGYTRSATSRKAGGGLSLEDQRGAIRSRFKERYGPKGFEMGRVFEDPAACGELPLVDRPEGGELFATVERGDVVIFATLDRGFCNLADIVKTCRLWGELGVAVVLCDFDLDLSCPEGVEVLSVLGGLSAFEWTRKSERTRNTLTGMRRRGRYVGGCAPYGFRRGAGGKLVEDEAVRKVGKLIVKWRMMGHSWERIGSHLINQKILNYGHYPPRDWSVGAIRRAFAGECKLMALESQGVDPLTHRAGVDSSPPAG